MFACRHTWPVTCTRVDAHWVLPTVHAVLRVASDAQEFGCTGSQAAAQSAKAAAGVIVQREMEELEKFEAAVQIAALEAKLA
jgi:hypothetical protein